MRKHKNNEGTGRGQKGNPGTGDKKKKKRGIRRKRRGGVISRGAAGDCLGAFNGVSQTGREREQNNLKKENPDFKEGTGRRKKIKDVGLTCAGWDLESLCLSWGLPCGEIWRASLLGKWKKSPS